MRPIPRSAKILPTPIPEPSHDEQNIYDPDYLEEMIDADEIDGLEEGFMTGYLSC